MPLAAVAAVVLMGAALLLTVWTSYRGVRDASETLVRGNAGAFADALRTHLAELEGEVDQTALTTFLEAQRGEGLRFVALTQGERGEPISAGESPQGTRPPERGAGFPEAPIRIGDRVRVCFRLGMPRARPVDRGRPRRGGLAVIEFIPLQAERLRSAAAESLRVGALAAGTLLVVAAALLRYVLSREAQARELERSRRLASLGQLSAVLAHEIRNPLASLKGNAQLLAQSLPEGERPRAKADRVVDEAIRLEQLTTDLLEFARNGELRPSQVEPGALLRDAVAALGAEIQVDDGSAPRTWSMDGDRMRQALVNLLDNALKAGAPVSAKVEQVGGELIFEVADSGPGIADEDRERIFEPFFTKRIHGTGLGLAVVKRVVELHQGDITVANAAAGGAVFRIALPRGARPGNR